MLNDVMMVAAVVLAGAAFVCTAYLFLLTLAAWWGVMPRPGAAPVTRFAILVPAHNEEAMLPDLLGSLGGLDYPRDLHQVWIVADNCTDATATIARKAGFEVVERVNMVERGKGFALDALTQHVERQARPFDAYVFIDADSRVSSNLLLALDGAFQAGEKAVQSHYAIDDRDASWGVLIRSGAMLLVNFVRPMGRERLGLSAGIKGTGMAVSRDLGRDLRWGGSLAEDAEYHVKLLLRGTRVAFAPEARVTAHVPATLEGAREQNRRWEAGRLAAARLFVPQLLRLALQWRPLTCLDTIADLTIPPLSLVAVMTGVALTLGAIVSPLAVQIAVTASVLLAFHVVGGLIAAAASPRQFGALARAPVLIVWKLALYASVLFRKGPTQWIRTQRDD